MDTLLALRVLTLAARYALVAAAFGVLLARGQRFGGRDRAAWMVFACQYAILAVTTSMVEAVWLIGAVAPDSPLLSAGRALYNPAYLLNATIGALVPSLLMSLLLDAAAGRRIALAAAGGVLVVASLASVSGATREWAVLMTWTQVIAFLEVGGYLGFWSLALLGRISRTNRYFMGLLVVAGLFALLLPIQAEFFELVGRNNASRIWHLNQFLQLAKVAAEFVIVMAFANRQRASLDTPFKSSIAAVS